MNLKGHRDILQRKVSQGKFSNWIRRRRGGFLSYWNHQPIKFEEEKRFGLKNNFVIMKNKR